MSICWGSFNTDFGASCASSVGLFYGRDTNLGGRTALALGPDFLRTLYGIYCILGHFGP
jgi:hypothetical protein